MSQPTINSTLLISGADFFRVEELNPYSKSDNQPMPDKAKAEMASLKTAFEQSGIQVYQVPPPLGCQDGIYTANWALCWRGKAVMSRLPNLRQREESYARTVISSFGYQPIEPPGRFSGQGDSLPCGNYLFVGSHYRTDPSVHAFLAKTFDCEVIGLQTVPALDKQGRPLINKVTGWPDSYFYDLDLALAVLSPNLIAWCPEAFMPQSRRLIEALPLEKISVPIQEAIDGFVCNLVSTGETVLMSSYVSNLRRTIEEHGFKTIAPTITELSKGGGYIRCCSLTLD